MSFNFEQRPEIQERIDPGRVSAGLFNSLWDFCVLAMVAEWGYVQQYDHVSGAFPSSVDGNPSAGQRAYLGPVLEFDGTGDRLRFNAHAWPANSDATFGFVIQFDAVDPNDTWLRTSATTNAGLVVSVQAGSPFNLRLTKGGVVSIDSSIPIAANVPYFIAVSYKHSTGATRFVVRRLDTGAISTDSQTEGTAYSAGDGTIVVGGDAVFSVDPDNAMAMAFASQRFHDTDVLVEWSLDPFGPFRMDTAFSPAGIVGSVVALNCTSDALALAEGRAALSLAAHGAGDALVLSEGRTGLALTTHGAGDALVLAEGAARLSLTLGAKSDALVISEGSSLIGTGGVITLNCTSDALLITEGTATIGLSGSLSLNCTKDSLLITEGAANIVARAPQIGSGGPDPIRRDRREPEEDLDAYFEASARFVRQQTAKPAEKKPLPAAKPVVKPVAPKVEPKVVPPPIQIAAQRAVGQAQREETLAALRREQRRLRATILLLAAA